MRNQENKFKKFYRIHEDKILMTVCIVAPILFAYFLMRGI